MKRKLIISISFKFAFLPRFCAYVPLWYTNANTNVCILVMSFAPESKLTLKGIKTRDKQNSITIVANNTAKKWNRNFCSPEDPNEIPLTQITS